MTTPTLIYCQRNGFEIICNNFSNKNFSASPESLNNLEVINEKKLEEELVSFFKNQNSPAQTASILLADEVIFTKTLDNNDKKTSVEVAQEFKNQLPFSQNQLIVETFQFKNQPILVAINSSFIRKLKVVFDKIGWKVSGITPYFLLNREQNEKLNSNKFSNLELKLINNKNFSIDVGMPTENKKIKPTKKTLWLIIIISSLLTIAALIFFLIRQ